MKLERRDIDSGMPWLGNVVIYRAILDFKDYEKLFQFMRWRCPESFERYGGFGSEGIEGRCSDGTALRIRFIEFRDAIDRHWEYLKGILSDGEDLSAYSETVGEKETLTLKCATLVFKTGQDSSCGFDRIWGRKRWDGKEEAE